MAQSFQDFMGSFGVDTSASKNYEVTSLQKQLSDLKVKQQRAEQYKSTVAESLYTPVETKQQVVKTSFLDKVGQDLQYVGSKLGASTATVLNSINPVVLFDNLFGLTSSLTSSVWNAIAAPLNLPKQEIKTFSKAINDVYKSFGGQPIDTANIQDQNVRYAVEKINEGKNVFQANADDVNAYLQGKTDEVSQTTSKAIKIASDVLDSVPQMALMFAPQGMLAYATSSISTNLSKAFENGTATAEDVSYALYSSEIDIASEMIFGLTENATVLLKGSLSKVAEKSITPTVRMTIAGLVKQAGEEGAEEMIAFPFQTFVDWKYKNPDATIEDYANWDTVKDWGYAGLIGFIAGGLMSVPQATKSIKLSIKEKARLQSLSDEILQTPAESITKEQVNELAELVSKAEVDKVPTAQAEVSAPAFESLSLSEQLSQIKTMNEQSVQERNAPVSETISQKVPAEVPKPVATNVETIVKNIMSTPEVLKDAKVSEAFGTYSNKESFKQAVASVVETYQTNPDKLKTENPTAFNWIQNNIEAITPFMEVKGTPSAVPAQEVSKVAVEKAKAVKTTPSASTRDALLLKLQKGQDITEDVKQWIKTSEAKEFVKDLRSSEAIGREIEKVQWQMANPAEFKKQPMEKWNLQLFSLKAMADEANADETVLKQRTYLKRLIEVSTQGKPEDVAENIRRLYSESQLLYELFSNEKAVEDAKSEIIKAGKNADQKADDLLQKLIANSQTPSPVDVVIINEYLSRLLKEDNYSKYSSVAADISAIGTRLGQGVQAFSLISASLPYRQISGTIKEIEKNMDTSGLEKKKVDDKTTGTNSKINEIEKRNKKSTNEEVLDGIKKEMKRRNQEPVPATIEEKLKRRIKELAIEKPRGTNIRSFETKALEWLYRKAAEKVDNKVLPDKPNRYHVLAEIMMNRNALTEIWNNTKELAKKDPGMLKNENLGKYFETLADPVSANRYIGQVINENVKNMETSIGALSKDYFLNKDATLQGFVDMLNEKLPDMDADSYDYLMEYVTKQFDVKMKEKRNKSIAALRKSLEGKKEKSENRTEVEIMIELLNNAVYLDAFNTAEANNKVRELWAKKLGIKITTEAMRSDIEDTVFKMAKAQTQDEKNVLYADMITRIASQMDATFYQKFNAMAVTSLLLVPIPLIRNGISNYTNIAMSRYADALKNRFDKIANVPQEYRIQGDRHLNMKSNDPVVKYVLKKATPEFIQFELSQKDKYELGTAIEREQKMFKSNILESARKSTYSLLTSGQLTWKGKLTDFQIKQIGDSEPFRIHFMIAMANKMNALNYNTSNEEYKKEIVKKATKYAIETATERVYRNRTWVANVIQNAVNGSIDMKRIAELEKEGGDANLEKAAELRRQGNIRKLIFQSIARFVITPSAVVSTAYKYSPIAMIKLLAVDIAGGNISNKAKGRVMTDAKKAMISHKMGQAIAGTSTTFVLGLALSMLGLLTGAPPDNEKDKQEWAALGKRAYAVYIPGIGSFSIDWLQPFATGLIMGAQTWQTISSDDGLFTKLQGLGNAGINALLTNSILDNETIQMNARDTEFSDLAFKVATNGITQQLPSIIKRFNKVLDPYVRDAYSGDAVNVFKNQLLMAVPFGSYAISPKYDIWGQPSKQSQLIEPLATAERFFLNMFSPFLVAKASMDDTTKEVTRVFEESKEKMGKIALPTSAGTSIERTVNGVKKVWDLNQKDYEEYAKNLGELSKKYVEAVINNKDYSKISDDQKAKAFQKAYGNAKERVTNEYIVKNPK